MPCSPIVPRKRPIPAPIPNLSDIGTALISHSRIRSRLTTKISTPDRNTAPNAVCQGTCIAPTTEKAK